MHPERDEALAYCRSVLLPIWERWTDGNLAMRRALDCQSADPLTHEDRLFAAQQAFYGRGETPDNRAAGIAAQATQYALLDYPVAMVRQVGEAVEEARRQAFIHAETMGKPSPVPADKCIGPDPGADSPIRACRKPTDLEP
jgi:hypothetical protein